jgi:hypothetical protein
MVFEQLSQIFLQHLNIHTSWVVPLGCMLFVMTEYRPITQVRLDDRNSDLIKGSINHVIRSREVSPLTCLANRQ